MLRTLFSSCSLLLAVATVILLHSAAILDSCKAVTEGTLAIAYANAVVWLALFVFLCLPLLRSVAKMIYVNAVPALVGTVTAFAVLYVANEVGDECEASKHNLLLTSLSNAMLALLLFFSELSCPKKTRTPYEELES